MNVNGWVTLAKCSGCKAWRAVPLTSPAALGRPFLCCGCDEAVAAWLARESERMDGSRLAEKAREYIGVPFVWYGADRNGVDCAGLILAALHDLGWTDWRPANYGRHVTSGALYTALNRFCDRVDLHCPVTLYNTNGAALTEAGDILLFVIGGRAQHLGISNGKGGMIHCHEGAGRVIEQPLDSGWLRRLVGVWRWRGAEE